MFHIWCEFCLKCNPRFSKTSSRNKDGVCETSRGLGGGWWWGTEKVALKVSSRTEVWAESEGLKVSGDQRSFLRVCSISSGVEGRSSEGSLSLDSTRVTQWWWRGSDSEAALQPWRALKWHSLWGEKSQESSQHSWIKKRCSPIPNASKQMKRLVCKSICLIRACGCVLEASAEG